MIVVSVYESLLFLVLRQIEECKLVFGRIGVLHCSIFDAVSLSVWGSRERFTII
jgi:hypothetical protein